MATSWMEQCRHCKKQHKPYEGERRIVAATCCGETHVLHELQNNGRTAEAAFGDDMLARRIKARQRQQDRRERESIDVYDGRVFFARIGSQSRPMRLAANGFRDTMTGDHHCIYEDTPVWRTADEYHSLIVAGQIKIKPTLVRR